MEAALEATGGALRDLGQTLDLGVRNFFRCFDGPLGIAGSPLAAARDGGAAGPGLRPHARQPRVGGGGGRAVHAVQGGQAGGAVGSWARAFPMVCATEPCFCDSYDEVRVDIAVGTDKHKDLCRLDDELLVDGFEQGDSVHVWSNSKERWNKDGLVQEVSVTDTIVDGSEVPAGSVKVVFNGSAAVKWIYPWQCREVLKKVPRRQGSSETVVANLPWKDDTGDMVMELRSVEQHCEETGELFTDPGFETPVDKRVSRWCRPSEITRHDGQTLVPNGTGSMAFLRAIVYPDIDPPKPIADWQLFRGTPRADDLLQGELGDCWFLSSLAALAEFQGGRFVRALLPGQSRLSPAGAYLVRLCLGGRWRGVLVDDQLPCIGGGRYYVQLAFCVTHRVQLWGSIIEKAFAKACGSYEAIVGGEAGEALSVLTGWPCTLIRFDRRDFDPDILWATLCSSRDAAFLMTCSTGPVETVIDPTSLVPNHVYCLLDVYEEAVAGGEHVRLLKIRNPHAKIKWKGAWSDASSLWTPELRAKLGCSEHGSEGVFFMALGDFLQRFAHCTICRIRSNEWYEERQLLPIPDGDVPRVALRVEAKEVTECSLSLVQPEQRVRKGPLYGGPPEPMACMGFAVLCIGAPDAAGEGIEATTVATAHMRSRAAINLDCWLHAGCTYLVVPLSVHKGSSLEVSCACVSSKELVLGEHCLEQEAARAAWVAYARCNDPSGGEQFHGGVLHMGKADGGSVVALAENRGTGFFGVQVLIESESLRLSRGAPTTIDWLPPGYAQIVQVAVPKEGTAGNVSWRSRHGFQMRGKLAEEDPLHDPPLEPGDDNLHAPFAL